MLREVWEPGLNIVFVGTAVDDVSDKLGFHYLHPRNRFWELLEIGGITPKRIITPSERKALAEGHASGSLSDPVRLMFTEKKISQLLKLRVGITYMNQRVVAAGDKDKSAYPSEEDIRQFVDRAEKLKPKILAFVVLADLFVELFKKRHPDVTTALGLQPFNVGNAAVWLLGSTGTTPRGEALTLQEDAFFALGERSL